MLILIWPAICRLLWVFSVYYHITDIWYLFLGSTVWNTGGDRRHQGIFPILNIIWTSFSAGFHNALCLVKRASLNSSFIRDFVINVCRIEFFPPLLLKASIQMSIYQLWVNYYILTNIPALRGIVRFPEMGIDRL